MTNPDVLQPENAATNKAEGEKWGVAVSIKSRAH